jgi:hypothetical protein
MGKRGRAVHGPPCPMVRFEFLHGGCAIVGSEQHLSESRHRDNFPWLFNSSYSYLLTTHRSQCISASHLLSKEDSSHYSGDKAEA